MDSAKEKNQGFNKREKIHGFCKRKGTSSVEEDCKKYSQDIFTDAHQDLNHTSISSMVEIKSLGLPLRNQIEIKGIDLQPFSRP
ncbi:hypothetical protein HAX54_039571, partial [Datura stramonium]|nr:hypothetical protein [Datura stramonium]